MSSLGNFASQDTSESGFGTPSTESLSSAMMSMYLWDACRKGKLFQPEIYRQYMFFSFADDFVEKVFQEVMIPSRFDRTRVFERFRKLLTGNLRKSDLLDSLESVDPKNTESIEQLAEKSKNEGMKKLKEIEEFLKQDIFPPALWMEISRLVEVFVDSMSYMVERIEIWSKLRPKRKSQIKERSRLAKWMVRPYVEFAGRLYETFVSFERVYLFMELVSCERESELFTEKLWTFEDEHYNNFEPLLFDLHNSITTLQQSLFAFETKKITFDFSKPTGWAFKELVQTVQI